MKDTKDIKDMSLLEISDALDTATYVYQNELSDLAKRLRELHGKAKEMESIVSDLAKWSRKYPKGMIHPMSSNLHMERGLEAIEERAKRITQPETK
jgi:hypothetical protein